MIAENLICLVSYRIWIQMLSFLNIQWEIKNLLISWSVQVNWNWSVMHLNSEMAGRSELEETEIFLSAFSFWWWPLTLGKWILAWRWHMPCSFHTKSVCCNCEVAEVIKSVTVVLFGNVIQVEEILIHKCQ